MAADVIDAMVGISPGSPLDAIRARRPEARLHAQKSYDALFAPVRDDQMSLAERFAVASFVTGLHGDPTVAAHYAAKVQSAAAPRLAGAVEAAIAEARTSGPYGNYPAGPLSRENTAGALYRVGAVARAGLGPRLAAAVEHAHMLVFHPRDAAAPALQAMLDAGWSTDGIVTLSQLVAFLSFQIRVVAGLRVLVAAM